MSQLIKSPSRNKSKAAAPSGSPVPWGGSQVRHLLADCGFHSCLFHTVLLSKLSLKYDTLSHDLCISYLWFIMSVYIFSDACCLSCTLSFARQVAQQYGQMSLAEIQLEEQKSSQGTRGASARADGTGCWKV